MIDVTQGKASFGETLLDLPNLTCLRSDDTLRPVFFLLTDLKKLAVRDRPDFMPHYDFVLPTNLQSLSLSIKPTSTALNLRDLEGLTRLVSRSMHPSLFSSNLTNLRKLELHQDCLTACNLTPLTNLTDLNLSACLNVQTFPEFPNLTRFVLTFNKHLLTLRDLKMPRLTTLHLYNCYGVDSLLDIEHLPELTEIKFSGRDSKGEGEKLKSLRPKLKVEWEWRK